MTLSDNEIDVLCDRFESKWHDENGITVEEFLKNFQLPAENALLQELLMQEIDLHMAAGRELSEEEYLRRFPDYESVIRRALSARDHGESVTSDVNFPNNHAFGRLNENDIPRVLGQFERMNLVARGAFSVVYKGRDTPTGEFVAIKFPTNNVLHSTTCFDQFLRESRIAKRLNHQWIAKSHGAFVCNELLFNVQEFVEGQPLSSLMDSYAQPARAVELMSKLANAIAYLHSNGIVHRDLKPANIIMKSCGEPKIVDLGLSINDSCQRSLRGQRGGTPCYMSPEQVMGFAHMLDGRSDIWSLGVILFELLTGRRPFNGDSNEEVFEEIRLRNEKPIRMIKPGLDYEIQRICHKCLSKEIGERYSTADELAQELNFWLANGEKWNDSEFPLFNPPGLASFDADDSAAYQQLLPGPNDKFGRPRQIAFWTRHLEVVETECLIPVGIIYGQSGSGKSSLVKAGIIPSLSRGLTQPVYIEATTSDTEVRLVRAIRTRFPDIPADFSLPDVFAWIRENTSKRTVVFIDQFEQWLDKKVAFETTQLSQAFKQCDGDRLSVVVMVRNEYWSLTSQFIESTGHAIREFENTMRVDLFDLNHAKKVLFILGRAYGKFPEDRARLTRQQVKFIDQVIFDVAVDNKVVCLHLAMFGEMFKDRDWSQKELNRVGGVSAVGKQFLQQTFDSSNSLPRLKQVSEEARKILELMLPSSEMNDTKRIVELEKIRDHVLKKSNAKNFDAALHILQNELRLIVHVEPDTSCVPRQEVDMKSPAYFQLVHDYLVPTIRNWLHGKKKETWQGRSEIRLNELSSHWVSTGITPMPTIIEFLQMKFGVSSGESESIQTKYIKRLANIYLQRACCIGLMVIAIGIFSGVLLFQRTKQEAKLRFKNYLDGTAETSSRNLHLLAPFVGYLDREIKTELGSSDISRKLKSAICKIKENDAAQESFDVIAECLPEIRNDAYFRFTISELQSFRKSAGDRLWFQYKRIIGLPYDQEAQLKLARTAIALFLLGDSRAIDEVFARRNDPSVSTIVAHHMKNLCPDTKVILEHLQKCENADTLFGMLIAASGMEFSELPDKNAWQDIVVDLYKRHPDSGIHAASRYVANHWKIGLPELTSTPEPINANTWWNLDVMGTQLTFVKINSAEFVRDLHNERLSHYFPDARAFVASDFWIADCETEFGLFNCWMNSDKPLAMDYSSKRDGLNIEIKDRFASRKNVKAFLNNAANGRKPVFGITFGEVIQLTDWLNSKGSSKFRFNLPSVDQWELALRCGSTTFFHFGELSVKEFLPEYAVVKTIFETTEDQTRHVSFPRTKIPNRIGLFDMMGNLAEYARKTKRQYEIDSTKRCFVKGGSFESALQCASGQIDSSAVDIDFNYHGFRLILEGVNTIGGND